MLVFPQWRTSLPGEGCRVPQWMPAERFAPYIARPAPLRPLPPQDEDDDSLGSSPELPQDTSEVIEGVCGWRGCAARLPNIARLSAHLARVHAQPHRDGLFYCGWKDCSRPQRGFNARYKMLVHVRTHTNERPHTCTQCQKSFSRAENLKIHLRSHSGEKPYVCPYEGCGKAYSNSSDRFKHTRTHTVDKPYCCKVPGCAKRYTDPSSLRKHVKTYKHFTNERDIPQKESSDERLSPDSPSARDTTPYQLHITSPLRLHTPTISTKFSYSINSPANVSPPIRYVPELDTRYVTTFDPYYPARVPASEMSYVQYSQMYDHAYRSYYTSFPVFRRTLSETLHYEHAKLDVTVEKETTECEREVPLNLIRAKMDCQPIEDLVRISDLPLDLSTKS